ncbi:2,3-dihydroxybenzoic acid decarboxylase [Stemphylium lycopersici]|nr:2,3-dihydroxybenzoic acid decarboxylase [Stemphylium lycopersici]
MTIYDPDILDQVLEETSRTPDDTRAVTSFCLANCRGYQRHDTPAPRPRDTTTAIPLFREELGLEEADYVLNYIEKAPASPSIQQSNTSRKTQSQNQAHCTFSPNLTISPITTNLQTSRTICEDDHKNIIIFSSSSSTFTSPSTSPTQPSLHLIATPTLTKLRNLGPGRLKDMRSLGHTRQIISHIPILAAPQACSKYNDAMASAVLMNAEKFAVLAMLPNDGKEAARELVRCVNRYGFVGGVVALGKGGGGMQVDREEWWELWNQAEKFRIPILIRGLWPMASEVAEYQHGLPFGVLGPILTHLHTSHTMSSLPIVHLYLNCVFDRHPNLRLILAHPGALPSLIPRIENLLTSIPAADKPKRGFLDVWQHNIYVTTADAQDMSSLRALLEQIPMDRRGAKI